ncbi:MAG: response regulator [Lachnospiraceae bacterium]|nr:response regulator [Lachnospiraceae bacterium]
MNIMKEFRPAFVLFFCVTGIGGRQALRMTEDTPYDLILMDQRMPEMGGTETLQNIRAQEGGKNTATSVICLTADAVQGARERYLAEGFTDYLTKPVEILSLEAALMKYLPQEKVERLKKAGTEIDRDMQARSAADRDMPASGDRGQTMSREEALRFIREETPKLLSSLQSLVADLNPYFKTEEKPDADAPEISGEELEEFYEAIPEFVAVYDQDGILRLLRQLEGYRLPETEQERIMLIRKYANTSDWNGLRDVMNRREQA